MKEAIVNYSTRLKTLWKGMASRTETLGVVQKRAGMRIALNECTSMTYQVASWTSPCECGEFSEAEVGISSREAYYAAAGS